VLGQVADPGSDFEDTLTDMPNDRIGHPLVESGRLRQGIQYPGAFILVDVSLHSIIQEYPDGLECVLQADLLTLVIGSAVIADGYFIHGDAALRHFDGQFRLYPKSLAVQWDGFQQRQTKRFIAGLHVGKVQVGYYVAERG
jgi:hypothetical protein